MLDKTNDLPFQSVFIVGAPRCGTHFIHALACTSERANPFAPEYHYFYFMFEAYMRCLNSFNAADSAGFGSKEEFTAHHFAMMRDTLIAMWDHLGKPESLVMKHCSLTPFLSVLGRRFPSMKFIAIQRDARDSVASEIRAVRKHLRDPLALPSEVINKAIARYNFYYSALAATASGLPGRLHCVRYEEIVHGNGIDAVSQFLGFDDIDLRKLWKRATFDIGNFSGSVLNSELWGSPMSTKHIGRYQETLPEEVSRRIRTQTKRVALAFEALCDTSPEPTNLFLA